MIRLLAAEANRLVSRRMIWAIVAGIIATVGLAGVADYFSMRPPAASELAQQQQMRDRVLADCQAGGGSAADCANAVKGMAQEQPTHESVMKTSDSLAGSMGGFLALLLGASFIGAEYRSGTIGNWLTFVPQRGRVYWSKAAIVAAASLAIGVLTVGVAGLLTTLGLRFFYPTAALDAHAWEHSARTALMVMAQGLVGFVAALIARHTVAAIGVMFGAQIIEQIIGGIAMSVPGADWLVPLLPNSNASAFVENGYKYQLLNLTMTANGQDMQYTDKLLPFANGATYLVLGLVALLVGAYLVFHRRDVN